MEKLPEPQDIMDLEPESIRHASEMGEREVIYFKLVHPAFYVSDSQFRYSGFMILSNGEVYDISLDSLDDGFPTIDSAHENLEQLYTRNPVQTLFTRLKEMQRQTLRAV